MKKSDTFRKEDLTLPSTSREVFDEYGDNPELGPGLFKAHYENLTDNWSSKSGRPAKTAETVPLALTAFMYTLSSLRHLIDLDDIADVRPHSFRALREAADLIGPKYNVSELGAHHN